MRKGNGAPKKAQSRIKRAVGEANPGGTERENLDGPSGTEWSPAILTDQAPLWGHNVAACKQLASEGSPDKMIPGDAGKCVPMHHVGAFKNSVYCGKIDKT